MRKFEPQPTPESLAAAMGCKTLFYGKLGPNTVWGFVPASGIPGVAIRDNFGGQIVMNADSLSELQSMMVNGLPAKNANQQLVNGVPRRARVDLMTPAELAIRQAVIAVEEAGAHPMLTDAVMLLTEAKERVADFVELPK